MRTLEDFFYSSNREEPLYKDLDKCELFLKKLPWKKGVYAKQNWRHSLHSITPYVGKITPSFAHWLIRVFSSKNSFILDPFCGSGTIPLEADLLGRKALGIDLNQYAVISSKAKFDRAPLNKRLNWIRNVELNTENINLSEVDSYVKQFYHPDTLKEIISIRNKMIDEEQIFLLASLLAISHGHRPQHLSAVTGYMIPYTRKGMETKYKNVKEKLIQKVERVYQNPFSLNTNSKIMQADIRTVNLPKDSIDLIISSPPYYETLDYVSTNKLRLMVLGLSIEDQNKLAGDLIQHKNDYLEQMRSVGLKLGDFLKKNGFCVFVLGDVKRGTKVVNTAKDISKLYAEIGYETKFIVEDTIPKEKSIIGKFKGMEAVKNKVEKCDRILVMQYTK